MGFIVVDYKLLVVVPWAKASHPLQALGAPVRVPWDFSTSEHTEPLSRSGWMGIFHTTNKEYIYIYLVDGFNPSEKYESQIGSLFPTEWKNKKYPKPPTRI